MPLLQIQEKLKKAPKACFPKSEENLQKSHNLKERSYIKNM